MEKTIAARLRAIATLLDKEEETDSATTFAALAALGSELLRMTATLAQRHIIRLPR